MCTIEDVLCTVQTKSMGFDRSEFELGECIGQGATSNVHRLKLRSNCYAAKVLKTDTDKYGQNYQDMLAEISVLSTIGSHPNLVEFCGACLTDANCPIVVLELVEGQDLEAFLSQQKPGFDLGRSIVCSWSLDLLSAVNFLHDRDPIIIHRDIKPANLLLSPSRTSLKLTDFGLAKPVARTDRLRTAHKSNTGTPRYRAPEVQSTLPHVAYTEKADIYSTALVLWFLLAGHRPQTDPRREPHSRPLPVVPRWRWRAASDLLERMWSHEPELRPSAAECISALRAAAPSPPGAAGAAAPPPGCYAWIPAWPRRTKSA